MDKYNFFRYLLLTVFGFNITACEDFDTLNVDPNNPEVVTSNMVMNGAQKYIMDYIYDNWFSGRQCLLYAQYWSQNNYTEEDRYQIRESTNNNYFNYLYMGIANLEKVMQLNTDEETAEESELFGANENQIAASKILKVWLMTIITDTWGNVPYSDIAQLEQGVYYPRYDDQDFIYSEMLNELNEAVAMINESEAAFVSGDIIYGGDASKWKKFGNSLKCRLAIHLSKVDPQWRTYITEAVADGVFTSNDDGARYKYSTSGSDYCLFYSGFYVEGRNDFTITRQFLNILTGTKDELNNKDHPWEGIVDPRLPIYTTSLNGVYVGFPYGIPSSNAEAGATGTPHWYNNPPLFLNQDFSVPLMTYAELMFILCEYNGFSVAEYREGVEASIRYWANLDGSTIADAEITEYVNAVSQRVDAETTAMQKYIDLYINGTEAWTEIRRTGYPTQLVRPGEISGVLNIGGVDTEIRFDPLSDVKDDLIARVKYPTNESTLNGTSWDEAVAKLDDGTNNYYTKMFWDVRTSAYDHPANR